MPPKRSTTYHKPARVKLEDTSKSIPEKRAAGTDLPSEDETRRRSLRKRQRIDLTKLSDNDEELHLNSDSESSLTSLEGDEVSGPSSKINHSNIALPASRTQRATAPSNKLPLKQLKLGDLSPEFKSKANSQGTSPSKPRKKKAIVMELKKPHPAPPNWERQYALIEEMIAKNPAPADMVDCCAYMSGIGELKDQRFGALVSLMLSAQTRSEVTAGAVKNLERVLPGGLTIGSILAADSDVIYNAIKKVSFSARKTEYIRATAAALRDEFNGDVPKTIDELCSLPGVGPKIAILVLQAAWDINIGIGVDVHVHRITNRLGWHKPETKTPEKTRLNLQSWLPRELHKPINPLLVRFGQVACLPVGPRCGSCALATEGLCPSARVGVSAQGRKSIAHMKKEKTETPGAPDLSNVGILRAKDRVKKEETELEVESDIGEPLVGIEIEE